MWICLCMYAYIYLCVCLCVCVNTYIVKFLYFPSSALNPNPGNYFDPSAEVGDYSVPTSFQTIFPINIASISINHGNKV